MIGLPPQYHQYFTQNETTCTVLAIHTKFPTKSPAHYKKIFITKSVVRGCVRVLVLLNLSGYR